ncbi:MAG: peptide-methionine (R)-S-oxide reductase MsrB [Planctomycetota bacterium]
MNCSRPSNPRQLALSLGLALGLFGLAACGSSAVDESQAGNGALSSTPISRPTGVKPASGDSSGPQPSYEGHDLTRISDADADAMAADLSEKARTVTREADTETSRSGLYWDNKKEGSYFCAVCGLPLYDSKTKFVSGTGWPSFYEAANSKHIETTVDYKGRGPRTEVHCSRCASHLGHIFNDGYQTPTGMRHCINSVSLNFVPAGKPWPAKSLPATPASKTK